MQQNHTVSNEPVSRKEPCQVKIRRMREEDLPDVMEIEVESFFTPYEVDFFASFLYKQKSIAMVAEREINGKQRVAGYIIVWMKGNCCEVVSIAVAGNSRQRGIGNVLMQQILDLVLQYDTINKISLHTSVFNFAAQQLYNKLGFKPTKWIKNYYSDENEDALLMELDLSKKKCWQPSYYVN